MFSVEIALGPLLPACLVIPFGAESVSQPRNSSGMGP